MRTPDEMAKSVLARRDRHFEEAARRKKAAVRTMSGIASCMCVMVIVFVMFLNTNRNKQGKKVDADLDPGTTCSASDDSTSEPDTSDDPYADTETTDIKTDTSKEKEGETAGPADTEKNDSETTSKPDPKDTSHISDPKNDPQTTKPDYTTGKPDDTTKSPDDTTSKPDDTSKSPDDTTEKPDDTTSKPDDPEPVFEFEIPDCSKDIMLRSDLQTYIIPGQGGHSIQTITSVIEKRCDFHLNPYYHYVPKYLMDKVNISQYVKAIKYEMGICGYEFNLMGFLTFYNFSDAELADWYYLNGGYYIYNIPFEIILARDEYAFADYYSVIDVDADGKMLYLEKLLAEEEMKKILLENLSRSDRENDKRAYALLTENGKKLTGYNFSIADLIFESDFTVKDVERFIGQYKALNKATRKVFDYDLSVIDEKNRTVKGKTSGMYPCEVDALLHK